MRERFSTATYCDFCGKGANEVDAMFAAPVAHICSGCVEARATHLHRASSDDVERLAKQSREVMAALSRLSNAARESKDRKLTRAASDLYYAANRSWHELDVVMRGALSAAALVIKEPTHG